MRTIYSLIFFVLISFSALSQQPQGEELTREQVMNMSVDELSELSFENLIKAMELTGVSSMEELTNLLINKDVSSASKRVENVFDSPLSSTVLTRKEIKISGATTIEEALRLVPGVIVREKTNGNYDVHIRGLDNLPPKNMMLYSENTNTLLMVDGRPMFNYAHGAIVWESLPIGIEDIDRIEVVRGASSALYGPNAVNGVINILTVDPSSAEATVSGDIQGGTQNTYLGNLAFRKKLNEKFSAGLTTNFQSRKRNRDEVYVFESGAVEPGFYTIAAYDDLTVQGLMGERYLLAPEHDVDKLFPEPDNARENFGVNAYLNYSTGKNLDFDLSAGYQDSYVNSSGVGDTPTSLAGRTSNTGYGNLQVKWGGLSVQTNYTGGTQHFARGEEGFKVDMGQFNASAEYSWQIKRLNIRPGINYQSVFYDDTPYLVNEGAGYFNERKELNTFAASLRSEFLAFGKLRLIAALRAEKYNYPDDWYPSWQFAGTLPIGQNQTLRAVYSRANRSSFMINVHSNYLWDRSSRQMFPQLVHFGGNKDYDLMTTDLIELGYRIRPAKTMVIDAEFFASDNKNFGALLPYQSTMAFPTATDEVNLAYVQQFAQMLQQGQALPLGRMDIRYQNMDLTARQIGASVSIDWVVSEKFITKLHGTLQKTVLDNYSDWNTDQTAALQLDEASTDFEQLVGGILMGEIPLPLDDNYAQMTASGAQNTTFQDDVTHKATPSFWGMAGFIYRPVKKFEISAYGYYLGEQTYVNQKATVDIDSKITISSKATFKPSENINVFINARNLLNNDSNEFAFMDNIGGIYLAGVQVSF